MTNTIMDKINKLEEICMYKTMVHDQRSSTGTGMRKSIRDHGKYSKAYRCQNICDGHHKTCKMYVEDEYTIKGVIQK